MNFVHDCDDCVPLGTCSDNAEQFDLYFCAGSIGKGSLVARYGSEGSEYQSLAVTKNTVELFEREEDYVLSVAYRIAVEKGLL